MVWWVVSLSKSNENEQEVCLAHRGRSTYEGLSVKREKKSIWINIQSKSGLQINTSIVPETIYIVYQYRLQIK